MGQGGPTGSVSTEANTGQLLIGTRLPERAGRCGAPLDPTGEHAHTCDKGRRRQARHEGQKRATARILRRHRIGVEEEVRVPEYDRAGASGTVQRARLDLRVEGGPGGPVRFADHKVTHPLARSYVRDAAKEDGATARRGERGVSAPGHRGCDRRRCRADRG